jgi:diacylglycerol O-acyltransferase
VISASRRPDPDPRAAGPRQANEPTRPALRREVGLGLTVFGMYAVVAAVSATGVRHGEAERNSRALLAVERGLNLAAEEPLNAWLAPRPALSTIANHEYAYGYLVTAACLLVWLYLRRPDDYRWARSFFLLLNVVGIACFALYPAAPPRLLPDEGFVDTVRLGHTFGSWGSPVLNGTNQVAAMPSLHVAWGLWVVVAFVCASSARWLRVGAVGHVALTTLVILATANHYLLDAVGGAVAVALAYGLTKAVTGPPRTARSRIAAAEAFFLHAETPAVPQHVGGLVVLRDTPDGRPYRERLHVRMEAHLPGMPRLRQRPTGPSRWRRRR